MLTITKLELGNINQKLRKKNNEKMKKHLTLGITMSANENFYQFATSYDTTPIQGGENLKVEKGKGE